VIYIKTYVPGISLKDSANSHTLRHNQYTVQFLPDIQTYKIPLKDFFTPDWWTSMMKVKKESLPKETFKNVFTFDIQCNTQSSDYQINKKEDISIQRIAFHRSLSTFHYILAGLLFVSYAGLIFFFVIIVGKGVKKLPHQKNLNLSTHREKELARIKIFIESHYNDPEISTQMVYNALGIPPTRVFDILKKEYHLSFKQIINNMRIKEAKRLLVKTDLRISEIVFQIGFNNISYFNNLFKKNVGETPSEYRKRRIPENKII
jgi:AraC-like DNA-binding protein